MESLPFEGETEGVSLGCKIEVSLPGSDVNPLPFNLEGCHGAEVCGTDAFELSASISLDGKSSLDGNTSLDGNSSLDGEKSPDGEFPDEDSPWEP